MPGLDCKVSIHAMQRRVACLLLKLLAVPRFIEDCWDLVGRVNLRAQTILRSMLICYPETIDAYCPERID